MYYLRTVFLFSVTLLCSTCIDAVCAIPAQKDPEYDGFDLASYTYDIGAWLGGQSITPSHQEEGEAHSKLSVPDGAEFITLPASDEGDETIPVFRTQRDDFSKMKLQHAFIVMHGKLRDGGHYWQMMDKAVSKAQDDHKIGDSIVVAPQFFSKKYNQGQYSDDDLAWADRNAWQSGSRAIHPDNTTLSSIDAIDAVIEHYSNLDLYPSMKNVTVIGHGGGGQLIQRYAVVARDVPKHLHLRFIHGDPSSCVYFTDHRTLPAKKEKSKCKYYNTWRYGFDHFPGTLKEHKTPRQYFEQYISRDVISIVGYQDVSATGDESCMAKLQGGRKRRDRNLIWYRYVNTLARTNKDLRGFPGKFADLPDWSDSAKGTFRLRLVVVQDVAHNMEDLLQTKSGKSALFDNGDIDTGWSPT